MIPKKMNFPQNNNQIQIMMKSAQFKNLKKKNTKKIVIINKF